MSSGHGHEEHWLVKLGKNIFFLVFALALLYLFDGEYVTKLLPQDKVAKVNQERINSKVVRVIDGDTLMINLNGENTRLRLIGINTPESVGEREEECFGVEAKKYMEQIATGKNITLEYDDSQGLTDQYGRLLAFVYLEDGQMLNRKMISDGYAYEYTFMNDYKYKKSFKEAQALAKSSERGLWSKDSCNGKKQFFN